MTLSGSKVLKIGLKTRSQSQFEAFPKTRHPWKCYPRLPTENRKTRVDHDNLMNFARKFLLKSALWFGSHETGHYFLISVATVKQVIDEQTVLLYRLLLLFALGYQSTALNETIKRYISFMSRNAHDLERKKKLNYESQQNVSWAMIFLLVFFHIFNKGLSDSCIFLQFFKASFFLALLSFCWFSFLRPSKWNYFSRILKHEMHNWIYFLSVSFDISVIYVLWNLIVISKATMIK